MTICVTGPMAAGKNAASEILESHGYKSLDADTLTHKAVENAKDAILKEFGSLAKEMSLSLTNADGSINRRNLGAVIFSSPELTARQEAIVYPQINIMMEDFIKANENCVINATVLYKVPLIKKIDLIIYVDAPFIKRLIRAKKRDNLSIKQILLRFKAQKNLFAKYKFSNADIVRVWNTGSRKSLESKILKILSGR